MTVQATNYDGTQNYTLLELDDDKLVSSGGTWAYELKENKFITAYRFFNISATSKTNTLSLPMRMKDTSYVVWAYPVFNGHLCHSSWAGTLTGGEGRTQTTVQISMDSTESDSNVTFALLIRGYIEV